MLGYRFDNIKNNNIDACQAHVQGVNSMNFIGIKFFLDFKHNRCFYVFDFYKDVLL